MHETRNLETLKSKKVSRGEAIDPESDSDPDPDLDETRNLETLKPKITRSTRMPRQPAHRISRRLRAITSMPPTTPKRLSCPLP